ncbi:MAG: 30S ribosomal protein S9 [Rhodobacterales bacterium]|nr:30S ribosomal protein S9 [Rhodobacterales bacterium]
MADKLVQYYGTGRRKTATARVFLRPGTGRIYVNKREIENYFPRATLRMDLRQPLGLTENTEAFDLYVTVRGGGQAGQAGAVRLGIARALLLVNPDYRGALKAAGFLTRDARKVERKKYGRAGARAKFQFSKR